MKLHRLKLPQGFRSLEPGFEIHFLRDMEMDHLWDFRPYVLVGRNGSGKSNLLEALAHIFYHLECMTLRNLPDSFLYEEEKNPDGWRNHRALIDEYELEYFISSERAKKELPMWVKIKAAPAFPAGEEVAHVHFTKSKGEAPKIRVNNSEHGELGSSGFRSFLPEYVLGYSSGENEILSLPFQKMRFINFDEIKEKNQSESQFTSPEGRLVYLDASYSQAMLLCIYLMSPEPELDVFKKYLGFMGVLSFRLVIKHLQYENPDYGITSTPYSTQRYITLTNSLSSTVNKLKLCATAFNENNNSLTLDFFTDHQSKEAFNFHFENDPLLLFQALQSVLIMNLHTVSEEQKKDIYQSSSLYLADSLPEPGDADKIAHVTHLTIDKPRSFEMRLRSLSDGEHQLLHSLNLFLLFRNKSALFLLDEPETHFNPDWRAEFITTLKNCLPERDEIPTTRELLITSHSPFIVSDSPRENVLVFKKDQMGKVSCQRPEFRTFGASVNLINIRIFDKDDTIGQVAKTVLDQLYERYEKGENADLLIEEANAVLGDSVEKTIFINHLKGERLA
mgnify:CR=1 FL=1